MSQSDSATLAPTSNDTATGSGRLMASWVWSYKPTIVYKLQSAEDWLSDYQAVIGEPIDTLDRFWRVYSNIPTLSALDCGNIYALFRENITASWEDKANENGFSVVLYMSKQIPSDYMKKLYQNALFVAIGANDSFSGALNGCTFERKVGGNKIAFWMGSPLQTVKEQLEVANAVLKALQIPFNDVSLVEEELRIDWRDPKFAAQKITVKCISHKKRATDPVPPRNRSRPIVASSSTPRGPGPNNGSRGSYGGSRPPGTQRQSWAYAK